jgi:geranylgeranylglycerol-phosphate geranylgeranyltransferase
VILDRIQVLFQITRMHNCAGAALATLLGIYLAGGTSMILTSLAFRAAMVVWLIVAANNVGNDLHDLTADGLQKSYRPLPSGRLSPPTARYLAVVLFAGGLATAGTLGPYPALIAMGAGALGIGYSHFLKNTVLLGNAVVGLLSGITVVYGAMVVILFAHNQKSWPHLWSKVGVAALFVMGFVFVREILKTIADREDDAEAGLNTVATRLGSHRALRLHALLALTFTAAMISPWVFQLAPDGYLIAITLGIILPILGVVVLLRVRADTSTLHVALGVTKLAWFSGLLALATLR